MKCHEIDYVIIGDELQLIEVELDPQETVIAEAGAMSYMEADISFKAKMGDGSNPDQGFFSKVIDAGKRVFSGESLFLTHFTNEGQNTRRIGLAASYPGKILALNLSQFQEEIFCQKDAFLAAALGTKIDVTFHKRFGAGMFGGEGFILQKLTGDGMVFVHAGGTIIEKKLVDDCLKVDTGCVVGFSRGIDFDITRAGNLKSMIFGGEGMFLALLKGTGTVWLQSMPFSRLADTIVRRSMRFVSNKHVGDMN